MRADEGENLVDAGRARIGAQEHLAKWFYGPDGKPDEDYKTAVKRRFVQWVNDTCSRPYDQAWLNYQEEIGLRHTPDKKNTADDAQTLRVVPSGVSGKEAFELGDEIFYNGRLKLLSVSGKRLWIKTSTG